MITIISMVLNVENHLCYTPSILYFSNLHCKHDNYYLHQYLLLIYSVVFLLVYNLSVFKSGSDRQTI